MAFGKAIPSITQVALSTVAQALRSSTVFTPQVPPAFFGAISTLPWAIVASSTVASSTLGYPMAISQEFRLSSPMTTGAIWGIAPAGTAPIVSVYQF